MHLFVSPSSDESLGIPATSRSPAKTELVDNEPLNTASTTSIDDHCEQLPHPKAEILEHHEVESFE